MATTEHTLQLKAILDSKQVQQELQRLRQMQQTQTGQSSTGNIAQRTTSTPVTALGRFDIQIQGLSKNISLLTTAIQRLNSFNAKPSAKSDIPAAIVPGRVSGLGRSMSQLFERQVDTTLYKTLLMHGKTLPEKSFENIMRGQIPPYPLFQIRMQRLRDIIGPATTYNDYMKTVNSPEFNALLKPEPKYNKEMLKFIGGMALQQGLGSMAEYMQTYENQNVAASGVALQAGAKIGGYALMGAGAGGPVGAAVGAALGAVESLFDVFTTRAREAREKLDREWKIENNLKQETASFIKSRRDYGKNIKYDNALQALSEEYNTAPLSEQIESLTKRRDFVTSRLKTYDDISSQGFLGEADIKRAKELQQELTELDNKIKTATNTLKNYRIAFDNLKEADTYQESTRKLFKTGSLADIQSAYEIIKTNRDEAMASGNLSDIQKYNPRMRAYEQQIQRIREMQTQSALDLQRMDESYNNSRILERYGIGGSRGLRESLMRYGSTAVAERSRYEQLMNEGKLEEAQKAKQSWQFAAGERNTLADQLLQVLGNRTADLTNVTSLASMGFGMGEKNDNYDRQMKVWEDQRDLQRDIKNILTEKTFTATYGE